MKISVELMGSLKKPGQEAIQKYELPKGATVEAIFEKLDIPKPHYRFIQAVIDEMKVSSDQPLKNKNHVKLFIPVGGG